MAEPWHFHPIPSGTPVDSGYWGGGGAYGGFRPERPRRVDIGAGVADVAMILGVPAAQITPAVQTALSRLLAELGDLRQQRDLALKREAHLRAEGDRHPYLNVLNRHAFLRDVGRLIDRVGRDGNRHTFVSMTWPGAVGVRLRLGAAAVVSALRSVAEVLARQTRASDVVGSLGGYDFGLVLTLSGGEAAEGKVERLVDAVALAAADEPSLPLTLAWGMCALAAGDTADAALDRADADLRSRFLMRQGVKALPGPF
jgi:GGDEF domain-containing protein